MNALTAMKQALEALEEANPSLSPNGRADRLVNESITNLRTAITEMERNEPVGWVRIPSDSDRPTDFLFDHMVEQSRRISFGVWFPVFYKSNNREYEELRAIIDNGSESMTHEDAVKELRRLMYDEDERGRIEQLEKSEPVAWIDRKNRYCQFCPPDPEFPAYYKELEPVFTHPALDAPEG